MENFKIVDNTCSGMGYVFGMAKDVARARGKEVHLDTVEINNNTFVYYFNLTLPPRNEEDTTLAVSGA